MHRHLETFGTAGGILALAGIVCSALLQVPLHPAVRQVAAAVVGLFALSAVVQVLRDGGVL